MSGFGAPRRRTGLCSRGCSCPRGGTLTTASSPRTGSKHSTRTRSPSWLETLIGENSTTMTVAESKDHELLGFCRHGQDPGDARMGHVFSLYVRPSSSGHGVGSRLLAHAFEDLARRQLDPVTIWVFEKNAPARRLYSDFGFLPDGARRIEAEYGAEEIRLSLVLESTS